MTYRNRTLGLLILIGIWTAPAEAVGRFGIGHGGEMSWTSGETYMADISGVALRPLRIEPDQNLVGIALEYGGGVVGGARLLQVGGNTGIFSPADGGSAAGLLQGGGPGPFREG